MIGHSAVCHNSGGIGIDEDNFQPFLPQGAAGLGACIVEFGGLAYDNRAGAYNEDFLYRITQGHVKTSKPA